MSVIIVLTGDRLLHACIRAVNLRHIFAEDVIIALHKADRPHDGVLLDTVKGDRLPNIKQPVVTFNFKTCGGKEEKEYSGM